jgi:hypothetical protein
MSLLGTVVNGVIVPDGGTSMPEGTRVRIEPAATDPFLLNLASPDVKTFVAANNLIRDVELALDIAKKILPVGSAVSFEMAQDRESDAEWLVLRATLAASPDAVLEHYNQFLENWITAASSRAIDNITLAYAIV